MQVLAGNKIKEEDNSLKEYRKFYEAATKCKKKL